MGGEESGPLDLIFIPVFTLALLASFTGKASAALSGLLSTSSYFFLILIFLGLVIYIEALLVCHSWKVLVSLGLSSFKVTVFQPNQTKLGSFASAYELR